MPESSLKRFKMHVSKNKKQIDTLHQSGCSLMADFDVFDTKQSDQSMEPTAVSFP
jgi:hypothetical protein